MRIELTTYALRVRCSTPELPGRAFPTLGYRRYPQSSSWQGDHCLDTESTIDLSWFRNGIGPQFPNGIESAGYAGLTGAAFLKHLGVRMLCSEITDHRKILLMVKRLSKANLLSNLGDQKL